MNDLTQERLQELLKYDSLTGVFTRLVTQGGKLPGTHAGWVHRKGHREIKIDGKCYKAHRLAWLYMHGEWPVDQIDHINWAKDDNRIVNLRESDHAMNQQNIKGAHRNNKLGLLGVCKPKGMRRYRAAIGVHGRVLYLGYHDTPELAHQVYLTAKRKLHKGCTI